MLNMLSNNTLIDLRNYNVPENVLNVTLDLYNIKFKLKKTKDFFDDLKLDIKEIIKFLKILKLVYSINHLRITKAIKNDNILGIDYSKDKELDNFIKEEADIIAISSNVIIILKDLFDDLNIINDHLVF